MRTSIRLAFLAAALTLAVPANVSAQTDFFDRAQDILEKYVSKDGMVSYSRLAERPAILDDVLYDIKHTGLAGRSAQYRYAFYLNAYNILVIANVVKHWPVDNPLEIPGFFDEIEFSVAGEQLTLNDVEHQKLLEAYKDPRIHFVLVCAGLGCPPLKPSAIIPSDVDNILEDRTSRAINTPLMVRPDHGRKIVYLSSIFDWYQDDFGPDTAAVINYINQYRDAPIPKNYKVEYTEYNWNINGN